MPNYIEIKESYRDWYCEDLLESYLNGEIDLDELITKLDYDKVGEQIELFYSLNLILTNKYPHKCYNEKCQKKLFFSDIFNRAKASQPLTLKQFIKIWIAPYNLKKYKNLNISIPFFCCNCYNKKGYGETYRK